MASVMLPGGRGKRGKLIENQELLTYSLFGISSVSAEISQQGILGVFQLVCLYECDCLCIGWEFLLSNLKTVSQKKRKN